MAATTCWGIALVLCASLPVVVTRGQESGQTLPILTQGTAALPGTPVTIAPPPPIYSLMWRLGLGAHGPQRLALEGETLVVSSDAGLSAFSAADGKALWTSSLVPANAVATGDGNVYVHTATALVAIDLASGAERWRSSVGPPSVAPIWRGGWLLAASGTTLQAFRAKDGTSVWQVPLAATPSGGMEIDGDHVFVPIGDGKSEAIAAIDLPSHKTAWTTPLDTRPVNMIAANGRLYFGGEYGVYAYSQDDGKRLWTVREKPGVSIGLAADERAVYVALRNQTLYALDKASGNQKWRGQLPARPRATIFCAGGQVVVPLDSGDLVSWPARDGKPRLVLRFLAAPDLPAGIPPNLEDAAVAADGRRVFVITSAVGDRTLTAASRVLPSAKTTGSPRPGGF